MEEVQKHTPLNESERKHFIVGGALKGAAIILARVLHALELTEGMQSKIYDEKRNLTYQITFKIIPNGETGNESSGGSEDNSGGAEG
jgi:hypothetical protein